MKNITTIILLLLLSPSAFSKVDGVRKCLNRALIKSMNMKLQNLSQNNSIDEEVTFSCSNINAKNKHEFISIKNDKIKVMNSTLNQLAKKGSAVGYDFARLNTENSHRVVKIKDMCPMVDASYEDQMRRTADAAFSSNLKRCPGSREQFHAEYFDIMASNEVINVPIMDSCMNLVTKIKQLKERFHDRCNGNASQKPKYKKFGRFGKVSMKKAPTDAQILQVKILKAFKAKRVKYLASSDLNVNLPTV
jgi:hypothetical protein